MIPGLPWGYPGLPFQSIKMNQGQTGLPPGLPQKYRKSWTKSIGITDRESESLLPRNGH